MLRVAGLELPNAKTPALALLVEGVGVLAAVILVVAASRDPYRH